MNGRGRSTKQQRIDAVARALAFHSRSGGPVRSWSRLGYEMKSGAWRVSFTSSAVPTLECKTLAEVEALCYGLAAGERAAQEGEER